MGRAPCCDKANVKRGPWSPDEDATLKRYVETHGTGGNWISLPQKAGLKRCGKSCRLRWLNYLRPDIKHGGFTEAEDNIICSLYNQMGSRWSLIASQLPGRTDNDVKNYWNTKLKKKHFAASRIIPPPLIPEPSIIPGPKPEPGFSYYPVLSDSDYGILSSVTNLSPTNNILFPSPEPGQFGVPSSEDSETMAAAAAVDGILGDFGGFEFSYDLVNGMWSGGGGGGTVQEDQKAGPGAGGGTAPIFPC